MSFGFGVGDFLAVIKLAEKIRKTFKEAPRQFNAISEEVRSLSHVIHDCKVDLSVEELSEKQKENLLDIEQGCHNVLLEIENTISRYSQLEDNPNSKTDRVKRVWKRLKWEPADISDLRSRVTSTVVILNAFIGGVTQNNVSKLVQRQQNQEYREILDWLSSETYATQQSDHISQRQEGTGEWLLDSPEFQKWISTPKETLFCPGIPGAGKTIMAAAVIEELNTLHGNDSDVGIAYFFCNYRRPEEQKPVNLLTSLLRQLAQEQSPLPSTLRTLHDQHKSKGTRPTLAEISKTLHSVSSHLTRIFIVIDALDECEVSGLSRDKVLDVIFDLQSKHNLNILATSRFLPDIVERFTGSPSREISASRHDVKRYLEENLTSLPRCVSKSPELQEEIITSIIATVDGMFLLAKLYLDSLIGKKSPKAIRIALAGLSKGLNAYEAAYNGAMERIQGQLPEQKDTALEILSWIACAKRQLTTKELQTALAVEIGESKFDSDNMPDLTDMVSVCAGLVAVDEESGIIRLVHYTTQEYFTRNWERWFPDAHVRISRVCITYLSFDEFATDDHFLDGVEPVGLVSHEIKSFVSSGECKASFLSSDGKFEWQLSRPLYSYAARNWHTHDWTRATEEGIPEFVLNQRKLVAYSGWFYIGGPHALSRPNRLFGPMRTTGLHLAAKLGLREMTLRLHNDIPIDSQDSFGRTALSYAAEYGHEAVAKLLLEKGADKESQGRESGRTPLAWAARFGHVTVVKLLLEKGVNMECQDYWFRTPLMYAADRGHETVVKLLLDQGADPNHRHPKTGLVPLSYAAWIGHEAVVKLLLENGADAESRSQKAGRTPLLWAANYSHLPVVKLLLEKGVDLECRDQWYRTPLLCAVVCGNEAVVKFLIEKGADLTAQSRRAGLDALLYAAKNGHGALVQLLLNNGLDPNSTDNAGRTPLSWASQDGKESVVQLLLKNGVDLATDTRRTLPSWVTQNNIEGAAGVPLRYRTVLYSKSQHIRTPEHWVSGRRNGEEVADILLGKGADPNSKDNAGRTPLSWAAQNGNEAVVQLLLSNGVDPDSKDNAGRTPLSWAAQNGKEAVIQLLLKNGADLYSADNDGRTPLSWAPQNERKNRVKTLFENGANINSMDNYSQAPLSRTENEKSSCSMKTTEEVVNIPYRADRNLVTAFEGSETIWSSGRNDDADGYSTTSEYSESDYEMRWMM